MTLLDNIVLIISYQHYLLNLSAIQTVGVMIAGIVLWCCLRNISYNFSYLPNIITSTYVKKREVFNIPPYLLDLLLTNVVNEKT